MTRCGVRERRGERRSGVRRVGAQLAADDGRLEQQRWRQPSTPRYTGIIAERVVWAYREPCVDVVCGGGTAA